MNNLSKLNQRRLSILNWERNNRTALNRAMSPGEEGEPVCVYWHNAHGGCAVGRLLPAALANRIPESFDVRKVFDHYAKDLPKAFLRLGKAFLGDLQLLHDCKEAWNENGLTESGHARAARIERNIRLGGYDE